MKSVLRFSAILALAVALVGATGGQREPLRVWAASSLGPFLAAWGEGVEETAAHDGGSVDLVLDASSRLANQVAAGAPADVLITADEAWMTWAVEQGSVDGTTVRTIAANEMVLATASDGPDLWWSPGDAAQQLLREMPAGARVGIAGESVPAGRYARQAIRALGLELQPGPKWVVGGSVRSVAEWVAQGELPLGMVYASDATDPRLRVVAAVPAELHDPALVVGAVATRAAQPDRARAFLESLESATGQAALERAGFGPVVAVDRGLEGSQLESIDAPDTGPQDGGSPDVRSQTGPALSPLSAVLISLRVALLATLLSVIPAVGLGWVLARRSFVGKSLLSALLLTPLVIPPVVTGFLLLALLGSGGPVGRALSGLGLPIPFTFTAAVLAAAVVGFPLFVIAARNAFETVDPRYEEMSATLGRRPWETFRRVSLPLAAPGIAAGAVLSFARALGEFGATVVLAGNLEGETRTIALAVYTLLEVPEGRAAIWGLVGASVGISVLALAGFEFLSRRQRERTRRASGV